MCCDICARKEKTPQTTKYRRFPLACRPAAGTKIPKMRVLAKKGTTWNCLKYPGGRDAACRVSRVFESSPRVWVQSLYEPTAAKSTSLGRLYLGHTKQFMACI